MVNTNQWLYQLAVTSSVPQFIMVGTVYSRKNDMLPLFDAWEQCILHVTAHRELMPNDPSRPRFSVLDYAPTFSDIEHDVANLAAHAARALDNLDAPRPMWPTLDDGLLTRASPLHDDDLGRHVASVVGDGEWHDRRDSIGGPTAHTWMAISIACFHSLHMLPSYAIHSLWVYSWAKNALCVASQLGLRWWAQELSAMIALHLRCTVDATGTCAVGQRDVMAHIAEVGSRLLVGHGLTEDALASLHVAKGPPAPQSAWWFRGAAPMIVFVVLLMLFDFFSTS